MKVIKIKNIEIFSNGSLNFSYIKFTREKQIIFHNKDHKNSLYNSKQNKRSHFKSSQISYKTKYGFQ